MLCCLRLLAGGSFQTIAGDLIHESQATVSKTMNCFLRVILSFRPEIVKFPDDMEEVKCKFKRIANFPGVIGTIDGTHVEIRKPARVPQSEVYRNRKKTPVNCQVVVGPHHKVYSVVARWPGSTHDSRIFQNSRLKAQLKHGDLKRKSWLLGD